MAMTQDECIGHVSRKQDAARWLELVKYNSGRAPARSIIPEFDELTDRLAADFPEAMESLSFTPREKSSVSETHTDLQDAARILEAKTVALTVNECCTREASPMAAELFTLELALAIVNKLPSGLKSALATPTRFVGGLALGYLGVQMGYTSLLKVKQGVATGYDMDTVYYSFLFLCSCKVIVWSCIVLKNGFLRRSLRKGDVIRKIRMRDVRSV